MNFPTQIKLLAINLSQLSNLFSFVLIGYAIVGSFLGIYFAICCVRNRNPICFECSLNDSFSDKAIYYRIGLGLSFLCSFFPIANIIIGFISHGCFAFEINKDKKNEGSIMMVGWFLLAFIGWVVSQMLPNQNS